MMSVAERSGSQFRAVILLAAGTLAASSMLLLAAVRPVAAAGGCTFVAAVDPSPRDAGSSSLTVATDVPVTFWGTFVGDATVDLHFFHDGVPFGNFTPGLADADGEFLFIYHFREDQVGEWRVVASVPDTECAGEVAITVKSGSTTPDTAVPAPASPAIGPLLILLGMTLLLTAAVAVGLSRARKCMEIGRRS